MLVFLLVASIFIAVVFGKGGIDVVKGCVTLILGATLLLVAGAIF